jgi:DNA-binding NarL/FixJ family response regulator
MFCVQNRFPELQKSEETMETTTQLYAPGATRPAARSLARVKALTAEQWGLAPGFRREPPPATVAQAQALLAQLTARENQVLGFLVRGISNKVIASEMGVSQRTVEAHRSRIFMKMHVRNAVQLVACLSGGVKTV